jgi:hypothetical protein
MVKTMFKAEWTRLEPSHRCVIGWEWAKKVFPSLLPCEMNFLQVYIDFELRLKIYEIGEGL